MLLCGGAVTKLGLQAKTAPHTFMVTGGSGERTKMHQWIRDHLDQSADVELTDVTLEHAIIAVTGPTSRVLLEKVIGEGALASAALPFGAGQWIEVCGKRVWVQRLSYAGELGFELYAAAVDAATIHAAVVASAGDDESIGTAIFDLDLLHPAPHIAPCELQGVAALVPVPYCLLTDAFGRCYATMKRPQDSGTLGRWRRTPSGSRRVSCTTATT